VDALFTSLVEARFTTLRVRISNPETPLACVAAASRINSAATLIQY
jgi:hypothetical protein